MEFVIMLWTGFIALFNSISDSIPEYLAWVLLLIFTIFGVYTIGRLKEFVFSTVHVRDFERVFYGKVLLKNVQVSVTPTGSVSGAILLWSAMFYVLSYSLARKYQLDVSYLTTAFVIFGVIAIPVLWIAYNRVYAKEYQSALNKGYSDLVGLATVRLQNAVTFCLKEFDKLKPELDFLALYVEDENVFKQNLLNIKCQTADGFVSLSDRYNLANIALTMQEFIQNTCFRLQEYLNQEFSTLWPSDKRKHNFVVNLVYRQKGTDKSLVPLIIFAPEYSTLKCLSKQTNKTLSSSPIQPDDFERLQEELVANNIVHFLLMPDADNSFAVKHVTENLRSAIALNPKDHTWKLFVYFIAWPFYVINALTRDLLSDIIRKVRSALNSVLIYISKKTVRSL